MFDRTNSGHLFVALVWFWLAPFVSAAEDQKSTQGTLAESLTNVETDDETWVRCQCQFALGIQFGIAEEKLKSIYPRGRFEDLPRPVWDQLRKGHNGIADWIPLLADRHPTKIVENDLVNGTSSEAAKKLECRDAAFAVLARLVPAGAAKQLPEDEDAIIAAFGPVAQKWSEQIRTKGPTERMELWFELAGERQRLIFLGFVVHTRHEPAYGLVEANLLKRAAQPDDFFLLEANAYFRHRRVAADGFRKRLERELDALPADKDREFCVRLWRLLTTYGSIDQAIDEWLAGRIETSRLEELLERSIDEAWRYHSFPIEPVAVHRPIAETNLRALVAAAHRQQSLHKRHKLLDMAGDSASTLATVIHRTNFVERKPRPIIQSPEWQLMVGQLRELLNDRRLEPENGSLRNSADLAAKIVIELWGPESRYFDRAVNNGAQDWRVRELGLTIAKGRSLRIEAARDFLGDPERYSPQEFPKAEAAAVAAQFTEGTARQWREALDKLTWEKRLLFDVQTWSDRQLGERLWPRSIEFVDWQAAAADHSPATFERLWQRSLANKTLDEAAWTAMQEWLASEAREGRAWWIFGESTPVRPGISLHVFPTPITLRSNESRPVITAQLESPITFRSVVEEWIVTEDGLEPIRRPGSKGKGDRELTAMEGLEVRSDDGSEKPGRWTFGFVFQLQSRLGKA